MPKIDSRNPHFECPDIHLYMPANMQVLLHVGLSVWAKPLLATKLFFQCPVKEELPETGKPKWRQEMTQDKRWQDEGKV
jgi:hypothetical protein